MLIKIHKNRSVSSSGTWGTKNENNYEILNFEFPEELEEYNKRIVYYLGNQKVWDAIIDNKAILTNAITTKGSVKAYIWCTKSDDAFETDVDFRTQIFVMNFFENDNADGIVPTEQQVDGFNTMLTAMNEKIEEIDELETTIENAETQRQANETTRQNNEATRQTNEQTRQSQEAERERKTNEAISSIQDKTAEYNANAEAKTTAFNNNATQKTNDFNNNYTQKVNDFNTNASSKELAFNSNAETKTNAFNTNATNKTNAFNSNTTEKTTAFDDNASTKTSEFNTNAESKTSAFNDNAASKTNDFNDNATEKTDEFNTNAQEKIDEYDEHIVEYQAQIDELQEEVDELSENMPWNTTEQATEISVDDAAKYSRNKMKVFGNTEQTQYSGKNLLDTSLLPITAYGLTISKDDSGNIVINGTPNFESGYKEFTIGKYTTISAGEYTISVANKKAGVGVVIGVPSGTLNITMSELNTSKTAITSGSYSIHATININYDAGTFNNYIFNPMLELSSTATDYEPYVGGVPAPNPNYPQDIHVVTGNNTIEVQGKNLFNKDGSIVTGKYLDANGNAANAGGTWYTEYYIPVSPNTNYIMSGGGIASRVCCYDENKAFLIRYNKETSAFSVTTPNNCHYIRLSNNGDYQNLQLEQGSTATDYAPYHHVYYPINLGSLELCKIGDYQDYLYKENGNWYKYESIYKFIYNSETVRRIGNHFTVTMLKKCLRSSLNYADRYIWVGYGSGFANMSNFHIGMEGSSVLHIQDQRFTTVAELMAEYGQNPLVVYMPLETPETTQITDENLISQLDAIYEHLQLVKGTNNISITASDLAPYMKLNYMQDLPSKLDNLDSRLSLLE